MTEISQYAMDHHVVLESDHPVLSRVNYVTRDNVLDNLLLSYVDEIKRDRCATSAEQKALIERIRSGDLPAFEELFDACGGMVTAIGYMYRSRAIDNSMALLNVARSVIRDEVFRYSIKSTTSFQSYIAPMLWRAMEDSTEQVYEDHFIKLPCGPVAAMYHFFERVQEAITPEELELKHAQDQLLMSPEHVLRSHRSILRHLHLPNSEIFERYGIGSTKLYDTITGLCDRLGLENRQELALLCTEAGIAFDLVSSPDPREYTDRQLSVATLLHKDYRTIAEILGFEDEKHVQKVASAVKRKMGARSRTEVLLLAHKSGFAEYLNRSIPEQLRFFTEIERKIIPYLHLSLPDIVEKTGFTVNSIHDGIARSAKRVGAANRRELALLLYQQGYEFDIKEPVRPLVELFDADQMIIIKNLHLSDEDIGVMIGKEAQYVGKIAHYFRNKAGARTRIELLLMSHKFDTGERRSVDVRSKRERLADRIGVSALDSDKILELLEDASDQARKVIKMYYLETGEDVSWQFVADYYQMERRQVVSSAQDGILRIRKRLGLLGINDESALSPLVE
jgi:DNA-binding CsgD family transcriptional regulator/predicted DNA-binding protein YlxM (UPF0122 family)